MLCGSFSALIILTLVGQSSGGDNDCKLNAMFYTESMFSKLNIKIETDAKYDSKDGYLEGTTLTISCARKGEVFVNSVRNIQGVNITYIDEDYRGQISSACSKGTFYPDLFKIGYQSSKMLQGYRHIFCQPGCDRAVEYSHLVTYPGGTLTVERNSPPVIFSTSKISLLCKEGFVRANADIKSTEIVCSVEKQGWDLDMTDRMTCLRGCKDVRNSVSNGNTAMKANTKPEMPPFIAGDVLAFTCEGDRKISGYSTVTCNSLNRWSSDLPTCGN